MTANTKYRGIELCWLDGSRIVGMLGQRTMAGLTVDACMDAGLLHLSNVGMARFASLLARKVDRTGGNLNNGGSAVVAIFSEALWYNEVTDHQKYHEANDKQKSKPEKMPRILEVTHPAISLSTDNCNKSTSERQLAAQFNVDLFIGRGTTIVCEIHHMSCGLR
jgi:hypothetical protein